MVAPPGSILSVEQFIEKVFWPGTVPSVVREGEGPSAQVPQQVQDASSEATIPGAFDFSGAGVEMRLTRLFFLSQLCQLYMRLLKQVSHN